MSQTKPLTDEEMARLMMLIGALYDLAEIERRTKTHDEMITRHVLSIARELEKIILKTTL